MSDVAFGSELSAANPVLETDRNPIRWILHFVQDDSLGCLIRAQLCNPWLKNYSSRRLSWKYARSSSRQGFSRMARVISRWWFDCGRAFRAVATPRQAIL